MQSSLEDAFLTCFSIYESQLEQVQVLYEKQKVLSGMCYNFLITNQSEPVISRNAPVVAGSIKWVRLLQNRIEEPMEVFKQDKNLLSSPTGVSVTKLFNKVISCLVLCILTARRLRRRLLPLKACG